jgi:hypothetical protein
LYNVLWPSQLPADWLWPIPSEFFSVWAPFTHKASWSRSSDGPPNCRERFHWAVQGTEPGLKVLHAAAVEDLHGHGGNIQPLEVLYVHGNLHVGKLLRDVGPPLARSTTSGVKEAGMAVRRIAVLLCRVMTKSDDGHVPSSFH